MNCFKNFSAGAVSMTCLLWIACTPRTVVPQASDEEILHRFSTLSIDAPPDSVYEVFNAFATRYFGSHTDSLYGQLGDSLSVKAIGRWQYVSEQSAVVAWETNLPARTWVEYGSTQKLQKRTAVPERPFFIHVHYLKDLAPGQTYHYRLVSEDARGNRLVSAVQSFATEAMPHVIRIPDDLPGGPPYVLDRANTTYLVTADVIAGGTAFDVRAPGITLDLGGNIITHANTVVPDPDHQILGRTGVGVRAVGGSSLRGLKILNGMIRQGQAANNQDYYPAENMLKPDSARRRKLDYNTNRGFSNIELRGLADVEVAGVTCLYHYPQSWGMRFDAPAGRYDIHHNVFLDKGTQMFNRHGLGGARAVGFSGEEEGSREGPNDFAIHHNLVKRTRQNTFNAARVIYANEIYVDSWVVNSFAIQPAKIGGEVYDNRIFLTGYYACGILWASHDLTVRNNFIHMEGVRTMIDPPGKGSRLLEDWGEQDVLAAMRVTNYNRGGTVRENFLYEGNIILGRARNGSEVRGTEFFSDYSNKNFVFDNNIVRITVADTVPARASCVNTQGSYNDRSAHLPIHYRNSLLASNVCNIRFGDVYGQGSNHHFTNCIIRKEGSRPEYRTFVFDGRNAVFGHVLLDCSFEGGARYNDVYWLNTQSASNYWVKWTLTVRAPAGSRVRIADRFGQEVFLDTTGPSGAVSAVLPQCVIRPVEWSETGEQVTVKARDRHVEYAFSPYTVTVSYGDEVHEGEVALERRTTFNPFNLSSTR